MYRSQASGFHERKASHHAQMNFLKYLPLLIIEKSSNCIIKLASLKVIGQYLIRMVGKSVWPALVPTTFPDEIRANENLTYKKEGSRRRAYTDREAAEANKAEQRRVRRKIQLNKEEDRDIVGQ